MSERIRGRVVRLAIGVVAVLAMAFAVAVNHVTFNFSDSLPIGFYSAMPLDGSVRSGDIIEVCAPDAVAKLGLQRHYLGVGRCRSGSAYLLKIAVATSGDRVWLRDDGIFINGNRLPGSRTFVRDRLGRPLPRIPRGTYVLEPGQVWLWTPNPHSWDSRYYGPVSETSVAGRAKLLLPIGSWPYLTNRV